MLNNITWILCINSTNRLLFFFQFMILLFLWQIQKFKGKSLLSLQKKKKLLLAWFLVKFVILPVRSIMLANWFAWKPACMSAIAQVLLTSLSTCTNQTVKWMNKFFWMKEIELFFFFQNVLFRWMFDSNDSVPLQFFWLKHNSDEYFFFHKCNLQLVWQSLNVSKSNVCHMDSTSTELSGN